MTRRRTTALAASTAGEVSSAVPLCSTSGRSAAAEEQDIPMNELESHRVDTVAGEAGTPPVHRIIDAAFRCLTEEEVPWALLRGADDLARPSGDVDLLVEGAALPQVDRALEAAGLRRLGMRGHGSHRFYFAYDPRDDLWIKLDVVSSVDFGRFQQLRSPLAAACLARRRLVDGLWRLAADDEAWLLLLHLLLDKGRVPADRRRPARAAAEQAALSSPVVAFLEEKVGSGSAAAISEAVRHERWAEAEQLGASLARRWASRHRARSWSAGLATRVARRLELPVSQHPRGLTVALVGPDGAGKTTLSEALQARFPTPTRSVYMGLWRESRWDDAFSRIPAGRLLQRTSRIVRSSVNAHRHSLRGRIVLLDRFTQDAALPDSSDTSRGGRVNQVLSTLLAPRPDLVVLLDAPGEVMFARKGEHSPELLEERRRAYLDIVAEFPESTVLDATRPAPEVTRAALAAVWRTVSARTAHGPADRVRGSRLRGPRR